MELDRFPSDGRGMCRREVIPGEMKIWDWVVVVGDDVVRIPRILRIHGRTYAARDSDFHPIEGGCAWDFEVYLNLYG